MPSSSSSSCSSSSSSSSSFSSCSSSSSWAGFAVSKTEVTDRGCFEILAQTGSTVIVNSGVGYDGYGNRLALKDRRTATLDWAAVVGPSAYLCIRQRASYRLIDYQDHPVYCLPRPTKVGTDVEFYLVEALIAVTLDNGTVGYYPPLDANQVICGIVLGKLWKPVMVSFPPPPHLGVPDKPDMVPYRSPFLAVKDGSFFPLVGFNKD